MENPPLSSPGTPPGSTRIDATLGIVLVGFRIVATLWMVILAVLALTGDDDPEPAVVVLAVAVAASWTAVTAVITRSAPASLVDARWLVPDLAVSLWVLVAPMLDGAPGAVNYSGGYPMTSVLLWAFAWGVAGALASAGIVAVTIQFSNVYSANGKITVPLIYVLTAAAFAWGLGVIRRSDRERVAAENALADERAERVRSQERAEMAARLHDSVLQTLALIQRRADDPGDVRSLARTQERSLRATLYGDTSGSEQRFAASFEDMVAAVENEYGTTVDVVTVGDALLDDHLAAAIGAAREALVNAAKHAGVATVAAYAEVDNGTVSVFVRDRGAGFDPGAPTPGRGIAESIVRRMERHEGSAEIRSRPGAGTEVELRIPIDRTEA